MQINGNIENDDFGRGTVLVANSRFLSLKLPFRKRGTDLQLPLVRTFAQRGRRETSTVSGRLRTGRSVEEAYGRLRVSRIVTLSFMSECRSKSPQDAVDVKQQQAPSSLNGMLILKGMSK